MSDLHRPHKALGLCGKLNLTKQNATFALTGCDPATNNHRLFTVYIISFLLVFVNTFCKTFLIFFKKIPKAFLLSIFFNRQLIVKNFIKYALIWKFGIKFFKIINVFFWHLFNFTFNNQIKVIFPLFWDFELISCISAIKIIIICC